MAAVNLVIRASEPPPHHHLPFECGSCTLGPNRVNISLSQPFDAKHEFVLSYVGIIYNALIYKNNQPNKSRADDFHGSRGPTLKRFTKSFYRNRKSTFLLRISEQGLSAHLHWSTGAIFYL